MLLNVGYGSVFSLSPNFVPAHNLFTTVAAETTITCSFFKSPKIFNKVSSLSSVCLCVEVGGSGRIAGIWGL